MQHNAQITRLPKKDDPARVPKPREKPDTEREAEEENVEAVVAEARAQFGHDIVQDIVDNAYLIWDKYGVRGVGKNGAKRT